MKPVPWVGSVVIVVLGCVAVVAWGMVVGGMGAAFIPWAAVRQDPTVRAFRFDPPVVRQDILVFRKGIEKTEPLRCLEEELVSHAQARARADSKKP